MCFFITACKRWRLFFAAIVNLFAFLEVFSFHAFHHHFIQIRQKPQQIFMIPTLLLLSFSQHQSFDVDRLLTPESFACTFFAKDSASVMVPSSCTPTELMEQAVRKWLTTHGPEEEAWRGQYVLRVSHCLEFLCGDHPLSQYQVGYCGFAHVCLINDER